jgi:hypothetical protein
MRKKVLSLAALMVLALAAIAYAQQSQNNVYEVTASTSPTNAGTSTKPVNIGLKFNYKVGEANGLRPAVIEKYSIRFAGLKVNTNAGFAQCTAQKINQAGNDRGCSSDALMGTGRVQNASGDRNNFADKSISCFLRLKVYNVKNNRATLYLFGGPNQTPSCPIEIAVAIPANYARRGSVTALEFSVPDSLKHPLATLDNAVLNVESSIRNRTKTVRGKKVAYYQSVGGCKAGRRAVTVVFTPEDGKGGGTRTAGANARCTK